MKKGVIFAITTSWLLAMGPGGGGMGMGKMYSQGMRAGEVHANFSQNQQRFREMDRNQDGKISKNEWEEMRQERMRKRAKEGRQMKNAQNAPSFEMIDTNGDGYIDRNEMRAFMQQRRNNAGIAR